MTCKLPIGYGGQYGYACPALRNGILRERVLIEAQRGLSSCSQWIKCTWIGVGGHPTAPHHSLDLVVLNVAFQSGNGAAGLQHAATQISTNLGVQYFRWAPLSQRATWAGVYCALASTRSRVQCRRPAVVPVPLLSRQVSLSCGRDAWLSIMYLSPFVVHSVRCPISHSFTLFLVRASRRGRLHSLWGFQFL